MLGAPGDVTPVAGEQAGEVVALDTADQVAGQVRQGALNVDQGVRAKIGKIEVHNQTPYPDGELLHRSKLSHKDEMTEARLVLTDALIAESLRRGKAAARSTEADDNQDPGIEPDNGQGHEHATPGHNGPAARQKSKGDRRWR